MNPTPLNLSVLKTNSYLRLDASGRFLVSQAGATLHRWEILPGLAGHVGNLTLVRKIVIGGVTVTHTSSWVTLTTGSSGHWGINTARFSGTPKLKVEVKESGEIILTLTGARFPGLDISADLTARLFMEGGVAQMELAFAFCGFSSRVGLADWLNGAAQATAKVLLDDSVCHVTGGMHLRVGGSTNAVFHPSWLFLFGAGQPFVDLTTQGDTISSRALALALLAPGMPSTLPNPAKRRSALFIPEQEAFDMPLWPERTEGWRFVRPVPAFHWLAIEADEQLDGDVRRAVVAVGPPASGILFQPGADLKNDYMVPFSIPLQMPVYAAVYTGDGDRLGAALLAVRTPVTLTAHTERCSLLLGPMPRKPGFMLLDIPALAGKPASLYVGPLPNGSGILQHGLHFALNATAPRLGEVVVDPMPPLTKSYMVLSIAPINRDLVSIEGEIAVSDADPYARIRLPEWILTQIVRPRDLMVLGLQFLGLRPEFHGTGPGRLFRSTKDVPRVVVYFPPQSLGERSFKEDTTTTADSVPATPINYRSAGLSRLAFDFRTGITEIPYTVEELLNWKDGSLKPRLDDRAISPSMTLEPHYAVRGIVSARLAHGLFMPVAPQVSASSDQYPPFLDSTAIEAPYRLLLSPDQYGYWDTAVSAAMETSPRAVLWHARLKTSALAASVPDVRAIWSVDNTPGVSPDPFGENASLTVGDRDLLVTNSALKAVDAKQMMLTSLGAWLNLDGDWSQLSDDLVTLEKWLHRSTLGRDQFVQVVKRGYLFPFGHKAVLIEITERKFGQNPPGRVGAWLRKRKFLVAKEYERNYSADQSGHAVFPSKGREIPFQSVRLLTRITPLLDQPFEAIPVSTSTAEEAAFWPRVGNADYLFNLSATDKAGNVVEFSAPLVFVRNDVSKSAGDVAAVIANQAAPANPEGRRRYPFGGQKVVFADPQGGADEALETDRITFTAFFRQKNSGETWARPFYPEMTTAEVAVPAMRQFANIGTAHAISFFSGYLANGFGGPNSQGELFARFVDGVPITYGGGNATDKVGGIVSPGMLAGGLSRAHGIVGISEGGTSVDDQLAGFGAGSFNPAQFFGGTSAKILGGIDLFSILKGIDNFASGGELQVPRWVNSVAADGTISRSFTWKTSELQASAGSFASGDARALEITCTVQVGADAKATLLARLVDFTITLADVIAIRFNEFSMTMEAGRKPEVNVDMGKVGFCGALAFVSEIEEKLHLDRFVDPPSIDVSAEGLSIGYGIQIPSIQVGAFALQNLALNASATLPFTGDPFRARFALSERQNPFLISVSLFTGGGFFAVGVGLDGLELLEVSLEFGGSFSLDIGVASGGVYVMAGIYIKYTDAAASLTGYVRAGGAVEVLGLITVSVEFYLGLTYEAPPVNKAWGEASMTVEVEVLFFSADVTLTVRREFAGDAADPTLGDTFSQGEWDDYCAAFAA